MADGTIKILTELSTKGLEAGLKEAETKVEASLGETNKKADGASKSTSSKLKKAGKTAAKIAATSATALAGMGVAAIKVGSNFESGMSQVAATMGITKDTIDENGVKPFDLLSQAAKDAGASTKFSASEAADGLNYLALAGYSAEQSAEALPVVLNLAAAGGLDLAYASDLATDAMAALGIEANKENLTEFGDKMAKTASKANTSVGQLGEAILTVGGTAKSLSGGTTELNAALGVLANRGIKGSEGGTALRNVILGLSAPTDKAAATMKKLGLQVNDAEGKMRPLNEIFSDLDGCLAGMTESEKTQVLNEIFNKVDLKSAQALLAGCGDEFTNLAADIDASGGAMQQMADTMNDNLQGQITILKSALEGLGVEIYESVQEPLKALAKEGTALVGQLTDAFKKGGFSGLAEEMGNVLATIVTKITSAAPKLVAAASKMINGLLKGIQKNLPAIAKGATQTVTEFVKGITSIIPKLYQTGIQLISELINGIAKQLPALIPMAVKMVTDIVNTLAANIPQIIAAGVELVKGLVQGLIHAIPEIIAALPQLIQSILDGLLEAIPLLIQAAIDLFMAILEAVPVIIRALVAALPEIITTVVDFLADSIPVLIQGAIQLFMALVQAIPTIISELIQALPQIITAIVQGLLSGVGQIFGAATQLFSPVSDAAGDAEKAFDGVIERAGNFGQAMKDASPDLMNYNLLLSGTGRSIREIDTAIDETEKAITEILKGALESQQGLRDENLENIRKYMDDLNALQMEKLEIYRSQQIGVLERLKAEKNTLTTEDMAQHNATVQAALEEANKIVDEACTNEISILYNKHKTAGTLNTEAYEEECQAVVDKWNNEKKINQQNANEAISIVAENATDMVRVEKDKWEQMSKVTETMKKKNKGFLWEWVADSSIASAGLKNTYTDMLGKIDMKATGAFLNIHVAAVKGGQKLDAETKGIAEAILTNFDDLPDSLDAAGKDVMLGLISGIQDQVPGLENASEMSAAEIVNVLRQTLDCHSPSKVTEGIGEDTMDGLTNGIRNNAKNAVGAMQTVGAQVASGLKTGLNGQIASLTATAKSIANSVVKTFRTTFDIHSPSKVTKSIGAYVSEGLAAGVRSRRSSVKKAAAEVAKTATDSIKKAESEYKEAAKKLKAENKKNLADLKEDHKKALADIKNEYQNALEDINNSQSKMADGITNFAGLFDAPKRSEAIGPEEILKNAQAQTAQVEEYIATVEALRGRSMPQELFDSLVDMGPEAIDQLKAFNAMTDAQLAEYLNLREKRLKQSTELAKKQYADERAEAKAAMQQAILDENKAYEEAKAAEKARYEKDLAALQADLEKKLNKVGAAMKNGLVKGAKMTDKEAKKVSDNLTAGIIKKVKKDLGIASPSKVFAEIGMFSSKGLGVGFAQTLPAVMQDIGRSVEAELSKLPTGAMKFQQGGSAMFPYGAQATPTYSITNNIESPVPTTVAESARMANRMTENTLFKLGVYGV